MDFSRFFSILFTLMCVNSFTYAQIESGKVEKPAQKPSQEEKKPSKAVNYSPATTMYIGGGMGSSFRSLTINEGLFAKPLGERANEEATFVGAATIGVRNRISTSFLLDFGVSYVGNGEKYAFSGIDTSFSYRTSYNYLAIPLKVQYVTGKKVKFLVGAGIQPQLFLSANRESTWVDSENKSGSETEKLNKTMNFFTLAAIANAGIEWQVGPATSLFLMPEFRYQLTSSYTKQTPYVHKGIFYGVQLGLTFGLN